MLYFDDRSVVAKYFPNKELYLEPSFLGEMDPSAPHTVWVRFEGNNDIVALMLLHGQLEDMGFKRLTLNIPFFPYSTMDHTDNSRPLSLRYIGQLINSMHFEQVLVQEAHSSALSNVVGHMSDTSTSLEMLQTCIKDLEPGMNPVICFPDGGAEKRYMNAVKGKYRCLTFAKYRDFSTGDLLGARCLDDMGVLTPSDVCIIVDDLCRSGRTFTGCADILKQAGATSVALCVTHLEAGAFSWILKAESSVDLLYATDSCLPVDYPWQGCEKLRLTTVYPEVKNHADASY